MERFRTGSITGTPHAQIAHTCAVPGLHKPGSAATHSGSRTPRWRRMVSLDGVAERPDGFLADWDDAMDANLSAVIAAQDSVILGRRSYEEWAGFWPGQRHRAVRDIHQRGREVRRHLRTARPRMGQCDCDRRRPGRVRVT
jgi:hypothetical protein